MNNYKKYKAGQIVTLRKTLPYPEGSNDCNLDSRTIRNLEGRKAVVVDRNFTPSGWKKG